MRGPRFLTLLFLLAYSGVAIGLSITRDDQVELDNDKSDQIFDVGSALLSEKNSGGDTACNVPAFRRSQSVDVFDFRDSTIDSREEFEAVNAHDSYIKVVSSINWCGTIRVNVFGCARRGRPGFIVAGNHPMFERYPDLEGLIWAHEYGHTKGLRHRSQFNAIMHPEATIDRHSVNVDECESFNR